MNYSGRWFGMRIIPFPRGLKSVLAIPIISIA